MRKIIPILLLICICMSGCSSEESDSVSDTVSAENDIASAAVSSGIAEKITSAIPTETELSTKSETETVTVADTTAVTEEVAAVTETKVETIAETETDTANAETTMAEITTAAESRTTTAATTAETIETTETEKTAATVATTIITTSETTEAIVEEDYSIIELEGRSLKLAFEDDFDGDTLDETKWNRCEEWKRQDLNCYWSDDMSYLDGEGNLVLETSFDITNKYYCGAVNTKKKFEQTYGYFETRCTVNTVPGYWTAFWLMGETVSDVTEGGINGTEIDIMESAFFDDGLIQHTLHWDGYGEEHKSLGKKVKADVYDGDFHTFALLWTEDEYIYYIDGTETWRTSAEEALGTCQVPLYLKLTAETGSWTMPKGGIRGLPDYMKIDYVRVYAEEKD